MGCASPWSSLNGKLFGNHHPPPPTPVPYHINFRLRRASKSIHFLWRCCYSIFWSINSDLEDWLYFSRLQCFLLIKLSTLKWSFGSVYLWRQIYQKQEKNPATENKTKKEMWHRKQNHKNVLPQKTKKQKNVMPQKTKNIKSNNSNNSKNPF